MPSMHEEPRVMSGADEILALFESLPADERDQVCRTLMDRPDTLCGRAWQLVLGLESDAQRAHARVRVMREVVGRSTSY
ncbi:MAG: hypothetical protein ACJ8F7_05730 [Gemmataceae bacterium]